MISYISTRNEKNGISGREAILKGIADDGGLYVPDSLEELKLDYRLLMGQSYIDMAKTIFYKFFPDFGEDVISEIVDKSYKNKFETSEITPVVKVGDDYVLELFHGATAAFKDVALSALPNLMSKAKELMGVNEETLILTATSGDTGSAALHGFSDVAGTKIVVFYPKDGISETQRLQMVTESGSNTKACGIIGNFDDAQNGVKEIFASIPRPCEGVALSSANSINIGRLVPQVVYYFYAYSRLVENKEIKIGDKVRFIVPTGNFGDIMAGYFALNMGLPIGELICASNCNDVLTEFLATGHYNRKREFVKTISPSMDILISSNLERLLYFISGEEKTKYYMKQLKEKGEYQISCDELNEIKEVFVGISSDDEEGKLEIAGLERNENYLIDTHTAMGFAALSKYDKRKNMKNVVLSTASAYKFSRVVLEAIGETPSAGDFENIKKLSEITDVKVPKLLKEIFSKEERHRDVIEVKEMKNYVLDAAKNL